MARREYQVRDKKGERFIAKGIKPDSTAKVISKNPHSFG